MGFPGAHPRPSSLLMSPHNSGFKVYRPMTPNSISASQLSFQTSGSLYLLASLLSVPQAPLLSIPKRKPASSCTLSNVPCPCSGTSIHHVTQTRKLTSLWTPLWSNCPVSISQSLSHIPSLLSTLPSLSESELSSFCLNYFQSLLTKRFPTHLSNRTSHVALCFKLFSAAIIKSSLLKYTWKDVSISILHLQPL